MHTTVGYQDLSESAQLRISMLGGRSSGDGYRVRMSPSGEDITQTVFRLGTHVRYVAFGQGQAISTAQREDVRAPSDSGSDFYEELLVNPTLLTLARQRGDLDCGGLRHLVIAYGNFSQVVLPLPDGTGHLSVCLERDADANAVAAQLREILISMSAT